MTIHLISLIFTCLLPLKASNTVTSGQDLSLTDMMTSVTSERFTHSLLTTLEGTSLNPVSEVSGMKVTPTKEKNSPKRSLQTTQTMLTKTLLLNTEKTATPTSSILPPSYGSIDMMLTTEEQATVIKSTARTVTNQDKENTSIVQFSTKKILSTRPPQSTNPMSNPTTFTNTKEVKSGNLSTVTSGDVSRSTGSYKTSSAKPPIMTTKKTKGKEPAKDNKPNEGRYHGETVAGLIGGALLLMMVGFLVIYIKKRKLQKQTITTTDWAGPSPFLEGGAENGQVAQRSFNRISLTTFLPQGVVKRLSLLPEADEELVDVAQGTTFRDKHHNNTFGGRSDGSDIQESKKETVAVVPEMESMRDPAEAAENTVSISFLQTNKPMSSNTKVDFANLSQDHCAVPLNISADAQTQMNNDLGQT